MSDGNYVSDKTGVAGRVTMSGSGDVRDRNICARRKRGGKVTWSVGRNCFEEP